MPTLNIGGKRVKVDDSFLSLSPEEQDATVDEISKSIGVTPQLPTSTTPSGKHLTYEEGLKELEKEEQSGLSGKFGAFTTGLLDQPIVGPAIRSGYEHAAAGLATLFDGDDFDENLKQAQGTVTAAQEENPLTTLAGNLTGTIGSMGAIGSTARGARVLGITGNTLKGRAARSAASSGAISAADTAARGGELNEVLGSGAIGATIGGAIPVVGTALRSTAEYVGDKLYPVINSIRNPEAEAGRRVGMAITRDYKADPKSLMSKTDEATARRNNIPVLNVDRGGETTRALARSVANQSPEARNVIQKTAEDRFGSQGVRAADFIKRIAGGSVDDLAYQDMLKTQARAVNDPAYRRAFGAPDAQAVFPRRIQQLMQSPAFRDAVEKVPARSADRAAVQGFKEIGNPFVKNAKGDYVLRRQADGSTATPSLRFWDQVKINLDGELGRAKRAGDNTLASDLKGLKDALVNELDATVPAYRNARAGAASFFDAEDALEAGKKFVNTPRSVPEAKRAYAQFSAPERKAFATGYASELIDKIKATGDRTNVITGVFKNQSSRESMEMVFGPKKMKEIEAYVRVEDLVDRLRGAMGNSTTARQLMELGIGAGSGWALTGGDFTGALTGALVAKGVKTAGQRIDNRVMARVAHMLTSGKRADLAFAVNQASREPAYMAALERLSNALSAPVRAGAVMANQ